MSSPILEAVSAKGVTYKGTLTSFDPAAKQFVLKDVFWKTPTELGGFIEEITLSLDALQDIGQVNENNQEKISWLNAFKTKKPKPYSVQLPTFDNKGQPMYRLPRRDINLLEMPTKALKKLSPEESRIRASLVHLLEENLGAHNYIPKLTTLLYVQECHELKEVARNEIVKVEIWKVQHDGKFFFEMSIPGILDRSLSIRKGDTVIVRPLEQDRDYHLQIVSVEHDTVTLKAKKELLKAFTSKMMRCSVRFTLNSWTLMNMHKALGFMSAWAVNRFLNGSLTSVTRKTSPKDIKLFNSELLSNEEQMNAVCHVVDGSSHPNPYIVFGPPGTGKTVTIVECILQVYLRVPNSFMVVCAPSNAAADLVAKRLLRYIPEKTHLKRVLAASKTKDEVDEELVANRGLCIFGDFQLGEILSARIVVVTLASAARLVNVGLKPEKVSHVFIDEAGQALETECLIALQLLSKDGHLVLSGDPHQLQPVVTSMTAKKYGFGKSMLERLTSTWSIYKKDANDNRNASVITMLRQNFRSHPKLIELPSLHFYENQLLPRAPKEITERAMELSSIGKKGFPIIFHEVKGKHLKENNSMSLFNSMECDIVQSYVKKLLRRKDVKEEDIGILSPYKKQINKIKEVLSNEVQSGIRVGSTEEFQGQERDVMIISTVRTSRKDKFGRRPLGFLVDEKRFNVAITRAKSLMIVVGDPELLAKDKYWSSLIKFVSEHGGLVRSGKS